MPAQRPSATSGCEQSQQAAPLLNHLVSKREQLVGHVDAECLGGLAVDDKFELVCASLSSAWAGAVRHPAVS
jgi:hypothetical protein